MLLPDFHDGRRVARADAYPDFRRYFDPPGISGDSGSSRVSDSHFADQRHDAVGDTEGREST
jgi:hypothetical protein